MFDSADNWRKSGFTILREHEHRVLVASHASAEKHLFKKYSNSRPANEQLVKYARRIEGANMLRDYVATKQLQHIVVPQKQLYQLPFDQPAHLLVVERMEVLSTDETERRYRLIEENVLRELCTVLSAFRGLDFAHRNCPFTSAGKIAFVDTEYVRRQRRRKRSRYLKYVQAVLSGDAAQFAAELWNEIDDS